MLCQVAFHYKHDGYANSKKSCHLYANSLPCCPSLITGKSCYELFHLLSVQIMTFPPGSNHVNILHNALGWIIEHYLLIPTCMICLLNQFLALCTHDCGIPHWWFLKFYQDQNFWNVCKYSGLSYTYWDILQAKFEKKLFVINCTNSDRSNGFSQVRNVHLMNHKLEMKFLTSENNSVSFLPLRCGS